MTKLIVQLLLSVIIGFGAALSISPKVQTDVHNRLVDANASLKESVKVAVQNRGDVVAKINAAVSAKSDTELSTKNEAKVELKLKNGVETNIGDEDLLPEVSVHPSLTNQIQTNLEAELSDLDVEVKEKIKSALDLDLDLDH